MATRTQHRIPLATDDIEVSERTIYRNIADLSTAGVPIRGEDGVGYAIDSGYDLPPMMFTVEEIEALVLGARMVEAWCELRKDFRNFRLDRIQSLTVLDQSFAGEPGKGLQNYYREMAERYRNDTG